MYRNQWFTAGRHCEVIAISCLLHWGTAFQTVTWARSHAYLSTCLRKLHVDPRARSGSERKEKKKNVEGDMTNRYRSDMALVGIWEIVVLVDVCAWWDSTKNPVDETHCDFRSRRPSLALNLRLMENILWTWGEIEGFNPQRLAYVRRTVFFFSLSCGEPKTKRSLWYRRWRIFLIGTSDFKM